ncbi:hypothetical protein EIN_317230 [Entamoeba invadens IP1]|uniref:Uncharacterized protein n=1 Tax=Entamoeba invadens IP1 TaxID=370355 RepID=A0A0A1TZH5_ENTIV|nr:hypothetical protein EIN_317230 [Entamoeba invadens IP1]ELP86974.1 hypothetical protein EIN_317230 [Entamoeba invadens IP1]|eukprot:XP_004253745.1 hypothetical protein EIN_317230 [Entamoeba invadens IP1]
MNQCSMLTHLTLKRSDFREVRNYQVFEQGMLLLLLNNVFTLKFRHHLKKANAFEQLLRIESIESANDVIEVEKFCEKRAKERQNVDISKGITEKTAKRRVESNRVNEMLQLFQDLLGEMGVFFTVKKSHGKKETVKRETIENVFLNGCCIDENMIRSYGKTVNEIVLKKLIDKETCSFSPGELKTSVM